MPADVPAAPAPLFGREAELATSRRLLQREDVRLLTLTGPAGTGKTRLAVAAAQELAAGFREGARFVDLSPAEDSTEVGASIAAALELPEAPGQSPAASVAEALGGRELLLVLDNFEQVLDAAPDVAALLAACPRVKALVTSRSPLRLRWEHELPVPPLALPEPAARAPGAHAPLDVVLRSPAVALFVDRAQAVLPAFALTAENAGAVSDVCRSLDGLPLAIELAAARIRVMAPDAMLAHLEARRLDVLARGPRDMPARHQRMRAALAWSHELLGPEERALFRRLGVFSGGWTADAAGAVADSTACDLGSAGAGGDAGAALDLLDALVESSLVQRLGGEEAGAVRFRLLETIRHYALEQLIGAGEIEAARAAHARHYLAVAEEAAAGLRGPEQGSWLRRLETERENLRAAIGWCLAVGDTRLGLRLGAALWRYWWVRGHHTEGRRHIEALVSLPASLPVPVGGSGHGEGQSGDRSEGAPDAPDLMELRAEVLFGAGVLAMAQNDYAAAVPLTEECLAIWRQVGDAAGVAYALLNLGEIAGLQGDLATARSRLEESHALQRAAGDEIGAAWSLVSLAGVARELGDARGARRSAAEAVGIFREAGERVGLLAALGTLASAHLDAGRTAGAVGPLREAVDLARELESDTAALGCLAGLARLALVSRDPERALVFLGRAAALRDAGEVRLPAAFLAEMDRVEAQARARLSGARAAAALERGRAADTETLLAEAFSGGVEGRAEPDQAPPGGLTQRELEVAMLVARGLTNQQVAERLVISRGTARIHVQNILGKLGFATRAQIAAWAAEQGLT